MAQVDTIHSDTENVGDHKNPAENHVEMLRKEQTQIELDPEVDNRVTWKFDIHIIPWLFGIWFVSSLS